MVFELLYPKDYLKKRPIVGLLLGIGYTIMGLFLALMIFRQDPALIAVGITSLLLLPTFYQFTDSSDFAKTKIKSFVSFFKTAFPYVKIYLFVFFGIFFTFAAFAIFLPKLAASYLFAPQLSIISGGHAVSFSWPLFWDLFIWNLQVLFLCFTLSVVAGNGAILFIAWNASVWGTIFGILAKSASITIAANPFLLFILVILSVFPHTFLEGLSYILSTISGTFMSDSILKFGFSKKSYFVLQRIALIFLSAVLVLAVACVVETFVLNNLSLYRTIIELAYPQF